MNRATIREKRARQIVASVCKEETFAKNFVLAQMIVECASLDVIARVIATVNVSHSQNQRSTHRLVRASLVKSFDSKLSSFLILDSKCALVSWLDVNVILIFVNHVVPMISRLPMKIILKHNDAKTSKFKEANINIYYWHHQMLQGGEFISR